jgi:large subunit ribosomal protein L18
MKDKKFLKRKKAVRSKITGTKIRPRMSIFRSNKQLFVQLIDDFSGVTLAALASKSVDKKEDKKNKVERAYLMGVKIAEMATKKKISKIVFDRGGYKYHGRIKALADGARKGGLDF